MALTEQKLPNQFLLQWKLDGEIQGCHIVYSEQILRDGELISQKLTEPKPVAFGVETSETALDLSEIVPELNNQLINNVSQLQMQNTELTSQLNESRQIEQDLRTQLASLQSQYDKKTAEETKLELKDEISGQL